MINGGIYENLLDNFESEDVEMFLKGQSGGDDIEKKNSNLLKRKRKRKNKRPTHFENRCNLKESLEMANTGSILVDQIEDENNTSSNLKLFITRNKEIVLKTNESLFRKGREINNNLEDNPPPEKNSIPSDNFWTQRYYYFSKFDEGIKLDYESWYSVTPEEISIYIAKSLKDSVVVDAFCGSGGNTIQFSKFCKKVYAIDIDPDKIDLCKNNSKVYDCADNIEFITCDYLKIKETYPDLKADYVFLSPPWGGINYKSTDKYSLKKWVTPDINEIARVSMQISENLVWYLPRNTELKELFGIISEVQSEGKIIDNKINPDLEEVEEVIQEDDVSDPNLFAEVQMLKSAEKIKALLIYFGDKYNTISIKDIRKYLTAIYKGIESYQLCQLVKLSKVLGVSKFFFIEYNFRKSNINENNFKNAKNVKKKVYALIKHIKDEMLTAEELKEFNQLEKKNKEENENKLTHSNIPNISKLLSEEEYNLLSPI